MNSTRMQHLVLGALAGFCLWALVEHVDLTGRLGFMALVFATIFFGAALVTAGPLGTVRALGGAAIVAVPAALLALWQSMNFATPAEMMESGHVVLALFVLGTLPVPFVLSVLLHGRRGVTDYPSLFMESWGIVVRYAAAALFLGVALAVLFISAGLLNLVGLRFLEKLLEEPAVLASLSGAVLGIALAIVYELSDMISPVLVLRLLRLLLPIVLVVVLVFVMALSLSGPGLLFGKLSASNILVMMALGAISLISIAVDQDDIEAVHVSIMRWSARGLAVLVPVLGGSALWSIWLRIAVEGWTPQGVMEIVGAVVVICYGVAYAVAALSGRHWMGWTRGANIVMALVLIGTAVIWMTPLVNPEAIASRDQLRRILTGETPVDEAPLWELTHQWGKPGLAAVETLRAERAASDPNLAARLDHLERSDNRWAFESGPELPIEGRRDALLSELAIWPETAQPPAGLLEAILRFDAKLDAEACREMRQGEIPGCVLVIADLLPGAETEAVLLLARPSVRFVGGDVFVWRNERWLRDSRLISLTETGISQAEVVARLWSGGARVVPSGVMALEVDGEIMIPSLIALPGQ